MGACSVGGSKSKGGAMMLGVCLLSSPAFMSVKHLVVGCANIVLAIAWIAFVRSAIAEVDYVFICAT